MQRQDATLEREPLTRLQVLDESTRQIPSSTREVQIAYIWRRVLQYQKDYGAARELTAGLERDGITHPSSRFMVACGYAILLGAGAAIGALLDEAAPAVRRPARRQLRASLAGSYPGRRPLSRSPDSCPVRGFQLLPPVLRVLNKSGEN